MDKEKENVHFIIKLKEDMKANEKIINKKTRKYFILIVENIKVINMKENGKKEKE